MPSSLVGHSSPGVNGGARRALDSLERASIRASVDSAALLFVDHEAETAPDAYGWWALEDSNLRPRACEALHVEDWCALLRNFLMIVTLRDLTKPQEDSRPPPDRPQESYPAATCDRSLRGRRRAARFDFADCRTFSITSGWLAAMWSSTRAGPSGVRRFASQAWTSLVLTFRRPANSAWEACSDARTRFTARPFSGFGGSREVVVRSLRSPCACSSASSAELKSSVNISFFMLSSALFRPAVSRSLRLFLKPTLSIVERVVDQLSTSTSEASSTSLESASESSPRSARSFVFPNIHTTHC